MKSAIAARPDTLTIVRSRSADYLELIRPRIASMVSFTVAYTWCSPFVSPLVVLEEGFAFIKC